MLIQLGNSKLNFPYFNLPATKEVCGIECANCYARKEEHRWRNVAKARYNRLQATLQPDFANRIISEIKSLKQPPRWFRIHASGEFTTQVYINDWVKIVKSCPDITFYSYTKKKRKLDFTGLESLPNCVIIDSFHFGGLNYGPHSKAPKSAFICPHVKGSNIVCGETCTWCMSKQAQQHSVYFIEH